MEPYKIDGKNTALVVIDLQKGIANTDRKLEPYSSELVTNNISKLVDAFRKYSAIVVLVNVEYKDGKDRLSPIADKTIQIPQNLPKDWAQLTINPQESDLTITKRQWGAFYGTELDLQLRRRKINTIVLCGISTNIGVETTAREAYQRGYNQIFVEDAMSAGSKEEHESSINFIFPRIGLIRKTNEIMDML